MPIYALTFCFTNLLYLLIKNTESTFSALIIIQKNYLFRLQLCKRALVSRNGNALTRSNVTTQQWSVVHKTSQYVISHTGQLSLVTPPGACTSTSESWWVDMIHQPCTQVLQCKLTTKNRDQCWPIDLYGCTVLSSVLSNVIHKYILPQYEEQMWEMRAQSE